MHEATAESEPIGATAEQKCSAQIPEGEAPPNPLFTPPCSCPRCAPEITYEQSSGDGWLRLSGQRQRYRVELVELGATGRAILG